MSNTSKQPSLDPAVRAPAQPVAAWIRFVGLIGAGLAATCISYLALSSIGKVYPTPPELLNLGAAPTVEERAVAMAAKLKADCGNGMIWLGVAGSILGCVLVLVSGLLLRSGRRTLVAAVTAALLAGLLGGVAGHWIVNYHHSVSSVLIGDRSAADTKFMLMHATGWAVVGVGIGLCFGLLASAGRLFACGRHAIVGAVSGGVAGAAFPVLVGVAAPLVDASQPLPAPGMALAVWLLIPAVVLAGVLGRTNATD